jgi:hypothetical protein
MNEPKVQPTKSVRKSVKFKICKDSKDNTAKFKSGKGCEPRYMVHLRFLIKLVFEDSHKPIENSNCEDSTMKYQVFKDGEYICKEMPELLEICIDLLNFLDFIIPKMLTVPAGHNYKSLQVKKLISIRTKVLHKINCITETSVVKHDINGSNYMSRHEKKMEDTMDILRNQNDKSHPSAIALRKEIEPYLSTPCTTPGNAPTDLSDDDDIDGGSSKKKYKRKSKKKRSFKKRTIKNKSNRKYR